MGRMAKSGPAPLIDETSFVPRDLDEARALSAALVAQGGVSPAQAATVVMFLVHLRDAERTPAHRVRASEYRRILARLGQPPWSNEAMGALLMADAAKQKGRGGGHRPRNSQGQRGPARAGRPLRLGRIALRAVRS